MPDVKMSPKMKLIDYVLRERHKISLKRYIVRARTQTDTHPAETWDEIAHRLWNLTDEPMVRETAINYARIFGIEPLRVLSQPEADEVVLDEDDPSGTLAG